MEKNINMKIANSLSVIFLWCVVCGIALPVYDKDEENYQQILAAIQNAKAQRGYGQEYDSYDYPPSQQAYQDYINELMREEMIREQLAGADVYDQVDEDLYPPMDIEVVNNWPKDDLKLGQVAGVAVDADNNPHIFHRANRIWDGKNKLFDDSNNYINQDKGPIKEATVLKLSNEDGSVLNKWGEKRFYLPHGLTIDQDGNTWLTDIALHQVFKFEPGKKEPTVTLGEKFKPAENNDDHQRFCKPTDVAVTTGGDFFVADGYCNSRVMKFDKQGTFLGQLGVGDFNIPHSLALVEDLDVICVADRENMRIMCYNAGIEDKETFGKLAREFNDPEMGRIYSIDYNPNNGLLYVVNGPTYNEKAIGFAINLQSDTYMTDVVDEWSPDNKGFDQPHAIAVSQDGKSVFVGEISPNKIWKFENVAVLDKVEVTDANEDESENEDKEDQNEEDIKKLEKELKEKQKELPLEDSDNDGQKVETETDEEPKDKKKEDKKDSDKN